MQGADGNEDYLMLHHIPDVVSFLLAETGSVWGSWSGRMDYAKQRATFGRVIGKGLIIIDGSNDTVTHRTKVCFGLGYSDQTSHWRML